MRRHADQWFVLGVMLAVHGGKRGMRVGLV